MDKYSKAPSVSAAQIYRSVALGSLSGVAVTILVMLLMAVLLSSVDLPESAPGVMSTACIGLGALLGGFIAAKRNGRHGLLVGFISGTVMYIIFALLALALGSGVGMIFITRLIVAAVMSALGGVLGINLRRKRKYV